MEFATREAVKAGRSIGPFDYPNAFAFGPKGFFVGVLDGEVVYHASAVTYPNHHSFMGGLWWMSSIGSKSFPRNL